MVSKATEYYFLPEIAFAGDAKAHIDVPRSLAGRTRCIYELLTGENPMNGQEPAATALNPDARLGHNHRGPPHGSAFRHPLAWKTGKKDNAGNLQQPAQTLVAFVPNTLDPDNPGSVNIRDWLIFVPPYWRPQDGSRAPYSKLFLKVYGFVSSAVNTDFEVGISARPLFGEGISPTNQTMRLSTTAEAAATVIDDEPFILVDGGYNHVNINFTNPTDRDVSITSIAICQVVKRRH